MWTKLENLQKNLHIYKQQWRIIEKTQASNEEPLKSMTMCPFRFHFSIQLCQSKCQGQNPRGDCEDEVRASEEPFQNLGDGV
jgi:hypothetical protein